jgi:hypothetical protein
VIGQRNYNFSSITLGASGVQGVLHVRRLMYNVASGQKFITPHQWEWFDLYHMNNPVPVNGPPANWAQYGQGGSGQGSITGIGSGTMDSGSFYLDPLPDLVYTLNCDCVCYPIALASDTDVEAIPYLFTDAVPFFAAYYALLTAQMNARLADAERMFNYYQTFLQRARQASNPSVNRTIYQQADDPTRLSKLGFQKAANQ